MRRKVEDEEEKEGEASSRQAKEDDKGNAKTSSA